MTISGHSNGGERAGRIAACCLLVSHQSLRGREKIATKKDELVLGYGMTKEGLHVWKYRFGSMIIKLQWGLTVLGHSGLARNCFLGGANFGGLEDFRPPVGSMGEAQVESGGKAYRSWRLRDNNVYRILTTRYVCMYVIFIRCDKRMHIKQQTQKAKSE